MSWDDKEPSAKDINAARMRAKYYGARYIIHRPLLYHALHYGQTGARVEAVAQNSVDSPTMLAGNPPDEFMSLVNGWTPPTVTLRELPEKLCQACQVCIESAILSTMGFDGIPDRLSSPTSSAPPMRRVPTTIRSTSY
jgi:hypothetical protein